MEKDKEAPTSQKSYWGELLDSELNDWLDCVWTLRQATGKKDFSIIKVLVVGMFLYIRCWAALRSALYTLLDARIYRSSQKQATKFCFCRQPSGGKWPKTQTPEILFAVVPWAEISVFVASGSAAEMLKHPTHTPVTSQHHIDVATDKLWKMSSLLVKIWSQADWNRWQALNRLWQVSDEASQVPCPTTPFNFSYPLLSLSALHIMVCLSQHHEEFLLS